MYPVKRVDGATSFHVMDFKISTTVIQDQAVIASTTGADGGEIEDATTTSLLRMIGSVAGASPRPSPRNPDGGTLTYSTVQADTEGLVRVYINPDAVYEALMSGGAAEGTVLQTVTNSTASAGGTTVTAADTMENSMDDGTCWGLSGNNVGLSRKVTTFTANTSWVVTVPFPRAVAVNDTYTAVPYLPAVTITLQLSTLLTQADASIAVGTGGEATILELILNGAADSYVHFVPRDHFLNPLS